MNKSYSKVFSPAELEFLSNEADQYGWYVWTERTGPVIRGLCARHLMAANGDFKVVSACDAQGVCLVGHTQPKIGAMLRYFELIGLGRFAFQALRNAEDSIARAAPRPLPAACKPVRTWQFVHNGRKEGHAQAR
ncbi:hypothetical protein GCM10007874_39960 [Labrys miyagiensis]|uniref:Uncharacterized protein n=2 Tax=Labrys miyagiensis TaxID=346912 RepID=A0ABQ6CLB7_9HYPH|nr:hypothetical protein GCM10007874_39960 [Labrys miyagiensis]